MRRECRLARRETRAACSFVDNLASSNADASISREHRIICDSLLLVLKLVVNLASSDDCQTEPSRLLSCRVSNSFVPFQRAFTARNLLQ